MARDPAFPPLSRQDTRRTRISTLLARRCEATLASAERDPPFAPQEWVPVSGGAWEG